MCPCVCTLRAFKTVIILAPPHLKAMAGDHLVLGDLTTIWEGSFFAPDMGNRQSWWHQESEERWQGPIQHNSYSFLPSCQSTCRLLLRTSEHGKQSQPRPWGSGAHHLILPPNWALTILTSRSLLFVFLFFDLLSKFFNVYFEIFLLRSWFNLATWTHKFILLSFLCLHSSTLFFFLIFFTPYLHFCAHNVFLECKWK